MIGAGNVGWNSAWIAAGMEAEVNLLDNNLDRLRFVDQIHKGRISTLASNRGTVERCVADADLVIGAVLVAGGRAPVVVTEDMVKTMKPGAVVVDVAIDQGGCVEGIRETSHHDPVYERHGVVHYAVGNIPGAVPPHVHSRPHQRDPAVPGELAVHGVEEACRRDPVLGHGLNPSDGEVGERRGRRRVSVTTAATRRWWRWSARRRPVGQHGADGPDLSRPRPSGSARRSGPGWRTNLPDGWFDEGFEMTAEERKAFHESWSEKLFEGGWICASWPKEYGGKGLSVIENVVLNEEFARAGRADAGRLLRRHPRRPDDPAVGHRGAEAGVPAARSCKGEIAWCQGFSEPNAGSDLAGLKTTAVLDGEEWVINGQKVWTTQAQVADYVFLLARTDPDAPKHKGISYLLVPMKQPGVEVRPIVAARRLGGVQRGVLHRRPLPEGQRRRRGQQRVEGGDDHPRLRAGVVGHHLATAASPRSSTRSSSWRGPTAASPSRRSASASSASGAGCRSSGSTASARCPTRCTAPSRPPPWVP